MKPILNKNEKRLVFLVVFLLLTFLEILFAVFVHDAPVRSYGSNVLTVCALYAFLRIPFPERPRFLSPCVFLFALLFEFLQILPLADLLHLKNELLKKLFGGTFDLYELVAVAAGFFLILTVDFCLGAPKKPIAEETP